MNALEQFHFMRPLYLLLIPLATFLWWGHRRLQDPLRGWRGVIDGSLLNALVVGGDQIRLWRCHALWVGWVLAIVAIAGPTWRPEPSPFGDDPAPVMVLLRAADSMDLTDMMPSRMERAQLKVVDLATQRKGQPMGLIAYAGSAHLVLPPTRDTSVVASMAAEISPAIMPKAGDNLGAALRLAGRTMGEGAGSVVVIADDAPVMMQQTLQGIAAELGFPISILAIAQVDTPELDHLRKAASVLSASVTLMTSNSEDVAFVIRRAANTPVPISAAGTEQRWADMGWWIVPLLVIMSLSVFRRVNNTNLVESGA